MSEESVGSTPFITRCEILGDLWLNHRQNVNFAEFIEYYDLGLPIAYAVAHGIVEPKPLAEKFINETFDMLLEILGLVDSDGIVWKDLDQMLNWIEEDSEAEN